MTHDVTRRDAFKVLATGAAGAVIGAAANAEAASPSQSSRHPLPTSKSPAAFDAARHLAGGIVIPESNPACLAMVSHCRSWSREVYLQVSEQVRGFVTLTAEGFALAAACQAAGRPVAMRYWGHEPRFHDGAGRFDGAVVAVDLRDLPGESASSIM